MDKLGNLAASKLSALQTGEEKPKKGGSSTSRITPKVVSRLWERMGMIYGHKWSSQYGHEDDGTWLFGLQAFTPDDLGRGVQRCIEHRDDWPPSLPEFAARCKDVREPMYKTFLPVLTKRADPVKARKHLANMRSKIGSAPRVDDEEAEARRKERVEAANEYCRRLEAQWRIENTYYPHNGQD